MKFVVFLLVLVFCRTGIFPMLLTGNWDNTAYYYKNPLDTLQPSLRLHESLLLQGRKLGNTNLSFSSNIGYTNAFKGTDHKDAELSHLYLEWADDSNRVALRAGRQGLYEAYRPLYLDGMKAQWRPARFLTLTGAGGIRVPSRFSGGYFQAGNDSSALNVLFRAEGRPAENTKLGLTFQGAQTPGISRQDLSLDARQRFSQRIDALADVHYDVTDKKAEEAMVSAHFRPTDKIRLHSGFTMQEELTDTASFADSIRWERHIGGTLGATVTPWKALSLYLGYAGRAFPETRFEHQIAGRAEWRRIFLSFRRDMGDLGTGSRADAGFYRRLTPVWAGGCYGSYMLYHFSSLDPSTRKAWLASANLDITPMDKLDIRAEYQVLGNRYFEYDNRVMLTTRLRFSEFRKQ